MSVSQADPANGTSRDVATERGETSGSRFGTGA